MKKLLVILMALALMLTMLTVMAGCGDDEKKDDNDDENITQNVDDDDDDKKDDEKEDEEEEDEDDIVGTWNLADVEVEGMSMEEYLEENGADDEEMAAYAMMFENLSFKFKSNGSFVIAVADESNEGEYEIDGNEIAMDIDGEVLYGEFKIKGDKLTITVEAEGEEGVLIFERD